MKPTILRSTLISALGVLIAIMGVSPVSGTPLLFVTGAGLLAYGTRMMIRIPSAYATPVISRSAASAHPCRAQNHAGCQDSPDCGCGCHRERIEVRINAF